MNRKTKRALLGSIANWESAALGVRIMGAVADCVLCELFLLNTSGSACKGCPVREATGKHGCRNTPYNEYTKLVRHLGCENRSVMAQAQLEVDFLKGLLP